MQKDSVTRLRELDEKAPCIGIMKGYTHWAARDWGSSRHARILYRAEPHFRRSDADSSAARVEIRAFQKMASK